MEESRISNKFVRYLMNAKVYLTRSTGYLTLFNSAMILFLLLEKVNDKEIFHFDTSSSFLIIAIFGILFLIFIGWVETEVFKGAHEEFMKRFELNPYEMEIKSKIQEIHKKLVKD